MKQPVCAAAAAVDGAVGDAVGKFVALAVVGNW